jgi:gluconokinase
MDDAIARGESAVVSCSALKRSYRDVLLAGRPEARLVFLRVDRELLERRLAARHGHFFPQQLLDSQLAALEPVAPDENAVTVHAGDSPAATVAAIIAVIWPHGGAPHPARLDGDREAEA